MLPCDPAVYVAAVPTTLDIVHYGFRNLVSKSIKLPGQRAASQRLSKDKSPYKTHAAAHFQSGGKGVHGPGYYLHLEPGECFIGGGMWMPEPKVLEEIRNRIVDKPAEWKKARTNLSHSEDALKRPPRGFDPHHPMIEDIKRKSFTTGASITNKQVLADNFMSTFIAECRNIAPLMKFLATSAGVPW